ncbi:Gibberellin receptor GID1 [Heracleum sosnowskyi]|uniref:Gibberellin receptor GID1 n=1 Tax=Heracleum sosnowskyi TaxID=360622 RepID=A0AAD8GSR3_9APIA|nr:Gibberellin receptor GID1 [Heracleum sosnowskyi]
MSTNSEAAITPYEVEEVRGVLHIYSDGSIVRSAKPSFSVPKPATSSSSGKLPIFYYIHGGGFCIASGTWPNCQNYCFKLASQLQAVVISPDYRLAPENRLPAAIEDGFMAVKWLQEQAVSKEPDAWLNDVADFSHVFISGDSAGGNIAHNLAVRLGAGSVEVAPVRVWGYVYLAPFFGGTELSKFEAEGPKDAFLNWELIERFWRLSIQVGETRDHPLVNPFGLISPGLEDMALDPILVVVGGSDLLKDRAEDYAKKLKQWGKKIEYEEQHGFFTINPDSAASKELMLLIKKFITENSS